MPLTSDTTQPLGTEGPGTGTQEDKSPGAFYNTAFSSDEIEMNGKKKNAESAVQAKESPRLLTEEERRQKWMMIKEILLISFAFMCLFTSYQSMANLQSSINKNEGIASLSIVYAALIISCLLLPTWLIRKIKAKWTMVVCMLFYSTYIGVQFYPTIYTLAPTAALVGLAAGPLWAAKCYYITRTGQKYAALVGEDKEVIITKFFGIFFLLFQFSQVWGNLISSLVLSPGGEEKESTEEELQLCGANFCQAQDGGNATLDNLTQPPQSQIYLMFSIYLVLALLSSLIIAIFVTPLERANENQELTSGTDKSGFKLLVATFDHLRHPYQLLLFPLTIWTGVEQAFIGADFTAAYVSCGLGVHMIGYVMMCYGVLDAFCSMTLGPLVKLVGRIPIITAGAIINLVVISILLYWSPHPDDYALFFVIASLWGVSDAVWQTQINAFYGVLFPGNPEAAFSNYKLWESTGFIIAYICSSLICVKTKILLLLAFLTVGMLGFYITETIERRGLLKKDSEGNAVPIDHLLRELLGKNRMRDTA